MDYFGMPNVSTHLRELCLFVDPTNGVALVPGDGEVKMAALYTKDVAWYISLALELGQWPRVMTTASGVITLNELVALVNKSLGRDLRVTYQSVSEMLQYRDTKILPRNVPIAEHFPEGMQQLMDLLSDLGASVALGVYDFSKLSGHLDLVEHFSWKTAPPMGIEDLLKKAWSGDST